MCDDTLSIPDLLPIQTISAFSHALFQVKKTLKFKHDGVIIYGVSQDFRFYRHVEWAYHNLPLCKMSP